MIGLARLATYTLHRLSEERVFSVLLNKPFDSALFPIAVKFLPLFTGTWADFFTLSIYTIITTTSKSLLSPLHEHFLMALSNVAPYLKSLAPISANKLVNLFQLMSSPGILI